MKKAGHVFMDKRRVTQRGKLRLPKPVQDVAPVVLTAGRTGKVLTIDQANVKAKEIKEAEYNKQLLAMLDGDVPGEVKILEWPQSPDSGAQMFNAIIDGLSNGNGHLSGPMNMNGDRRVYWRGQPTHVILSGDVCLSRFGITKTPLIINPFENAVSIGTVEVTR